MISSFSSVRARLVLLACSAAFLLPGMAHAQPVTLDPGGTPSLTLVPSAQRNTKPEDVAVGVWPTTILDADRVHHLARSQPTIMILALANPKGRQIARARMVVDLPPGVELFWTNSYLGYTQRQVIDSPLQGHTRIVMSCATHPTTFPVVEDGTGNWFSRRRPPALWLTTSLPVGSQPGVVQVTVEYQEKDSQGDDKPWLASPAMQVGLVVDAPGEAVQPSVVKTGVMGRFIFNSGGPQVDKAGALHDWLVSLGYNFVIRGVPNAPLNPKLPTWAETVVQNAYIVGGTPPAESAFIVDGKPVPGAVTPAAIYEQDPWVVEHVLKRIDQLAANPSFSWQWTNLEPYQFLKTGCQSIRNRDAFIKWSRLDADEVKKAWPAEVGKKFPEQWKRFQNWQVGQATRVIAQRIAQAAAAHGRDARLIFSTAQDALAGEESGFSLDVLAWGDMPVAAQTWSYHQTPNAAYPPATGKDARFGSSLVGRASWLRHTADTRLAQGRQERFSLVFGWDQTRGGPFYLPEHLAFNQLAVVLAGCDIVHNYAEWPVWDARYAAAIAQANTRIARWEPFITQGTRKREHVLLPLPPYPDTWSNDATAQQQGVEHDVGSPHALFSYEHHLGDKRLIAIANTWIHGDSIARLRIPGLGPDAKFLLAEPEQRRLFISEDASRPWLTGRELAQGVLVHVGAIRWACLTLEPYTGQSPGDAQRISPSQMEQAVPTWSARLQAGDLDRRTLVREDFSQMKLGRVGQGAHGEPLENPKLRLGYPVKVDLDHVNASIVERSDGQPGKDLVLADDSPRHLIYLAIAALHQKAELTCTLTPQSDAPFRVTLGAYIAELLLPSPEQWGQWFGTPYQPRLVYMQGDVESPGKNVTPIDTGVMVTPGKAIHLRWAWADARSTIWVDGVKAVDNKTFKVPNLAVPHVVIGTEFPLGPSGQPAALRVSDILIVKQPGE